MDSFQNRAKPEHLDKNNKKTKLNNESSTTLSPPSSSSSPSHEFSFTISLHSSNPTDNCLPGRPAAVKAPNNSFAVDLSPADDIFFHGHLLPLHLLSHIPPPSAAASPRPSVNTLDSFTLPIKDLILDEQRKQSNDEGGRTRVATSKSDSKIAQKPKPSSSSLFGMPKWRKVVSEVRGRRDTCQNPTTTTMDKTAKQSKPKKKQSKKKSLILEDVTNLFKRYVRVVRPIFFPKKNNEERAEDDDDDIDFDFSGQQHRSFSGNISFRRTDQLKSEFRVGSGISELFSSAPASMRTSPSNSGPLIPTPQPASLRPSDSSTMEELQAAIQAAIAHCKNSIAAAEEGKAAKA